MRNMFVGNYTGWEQRKEMAANLIIIRESERGLFFHIGEYSYFCADIVNIDHTTVETFIGIRDTVAESKLLTLLEWKSYFADLPIQSILHAYRMLNKWSTDFKI